jgi:hypothetical protein
MTEGKETAATEADLIHELAAICNILVNLGYGVDMLEMGMPELKKEIADSAARLKVLVGVLRREGA